MAAATQPANNRPANHYIRRLAGTPKACMVCFRPSPHVLVSQAIPNEDFFYVCESHLSDRHFATRIAVTASGDTAGASRLPDKVTQAEIDKIKQEYEEREKKKAEVKQKKEAEEKEKKEAEDKDKDKKKDEKGSSWFSGLSSLLTDSPAGDSSDKAKSSSNTSANGTGSSSAAPAAPTIPKAGQHERYQLHRDFFNMRLDAWKKREALKKAKQLNMPIAPKGEIKSTAP